MMDSVAFDKTLSYTRSDTMCPCVSTLKFICGVALEQCWGGLVKFALPNLLNRLWLINFRELCSLTRLGTTNVFSMNQKNVSQLEAQSWYISVERPSTAQSSLKFFNSRDAVTTRHFEFVQQIWNNRIRVLLQDTTSSLWKVAFVDCNLRMASNDLTQIPKPEVIISRFLKSSGVKTVKHPDSHSKSE